MEFITVKSFLGSHINSVIFTGGTAVAFMCESTDFPFRRRTNDIDILATNGTSERGSLKAHLKSIPHVEYNRGSESDIARYFKVGRYHIDLLKESLILLPPETINIQGDTIRTTSKGDLAGTKLARLTYNAWAYSTSTVIHDLLDTSILNEIVLRSSENHESFIQSACMIFSTRIAPYRVPFEDALSVVENFPKNRNELKKHLVVTDPESPLFGLDEKSFDNILNAFLKFTKQMLAELKNRKADYAEISDILHCSVTPAYKKPAYIAKHLCESGLLADEKQAKEYAQRCEKSPLIQSLTSHTPGF